jgi:malate permease and related proteins
MEIFISLFLKILPLYFIILLGFIAGKLLKVHKESIASLLIYFITPVIIFHGIYITKINAGILILPVIYFAIASILCLLFFKIGGYFWKDSTKNILAFASGTGNSGYFGLPVAVAIFGEKAIGIVALIVMGTVMYENSLGFFITARGHHTAKESFMKLVKLPSLYAFLLGLIFNFAGINFGQIYTDTIILFRGAYSVLGMMMIGMGLSIIKEFILDKKFILLSFSARFIFWPLIIISVVFLDTSFFHLFNQEIHKIMFILSLIPLAANTVSYAVLLKTEPEKASIAVLISTILSLFIIPLGVILYSF